MGCVILMIFIVGSGVVSIGLSVLVVGCLLELQPTPTMPPNAFFRCVCGKFIREGYHCSENTLETLVVWRN